MDDRNCADSLLVQGVTFKMCTDPDDVNGWTKCTTNPDTESELFEIDCEVKEE